MVGESSQSCVRFSECAVEGADISFALHKAKKEQKAFSVNSGTSFLFAEVSQHRACPDKAKPSAFSNRRLFVIFFEGCLITDSWGQQIDNSPFTSRGGD
jgi:hypothetical protein